MSSGGGQLFTQQFVDSTGAPIAGAQIKHFSAGTLTDKDIWHDEGKTTAHTQPYICDSRGMATFYADGDYRLQVLDAAGILLYDWDNYKISSDTATMWEGNQGTSLPVAATKNKGQLFLLLDASNNLLDFAVNMGAKFASLFFNEVSSDWYSSFQAAVTALGSDIKTLVVPSIQTVSANVTVPSNITLVLTGNNGGFSIDSGVTVTINGPLEAPLRQVFGGAGTIAGLKYAWGEWFGAKGDNSTDNATPIQAAIDVMDGVTNGTAGGNVYIGKGIFLTNSQIIVKNKVRLIGQGTRATILQAGGTFPVSTAMIRLGDGTSVVFDTRVERMMLDLNSVAGSTGVMSSEIQEQCGIFNSVIINFKSFGIDIQSGAGSIVEMDNLEILPPSTGATAGISLNATASVLYIVRHTTVAGAVLGDITDGITVAGGNLAAYAVHFEGATNGINFTGGAGSVYTASGHSTVTNVVKIAAANTGLVSVHNILGNGSTNGVLDSSTGRTLTSSLSYYHAKGGSFFGVSKMAYIDTLSLNVITGNNNDVGIGSARGRIQFAAAAGNANITGMAAGVEGDILILESKSSSTVTLVQESTLSVATNRFRTTTGTDYVIAKDAMVIVMYSGGKWTVMEGNSRPYLFGSASLNFTLTTVTSQDLTITVAGAAVGDVVNLGVPNASVAVDTLFWAWVSAPDTVTVRAMKNLAGAAPASGTFTAHVWR